MDQNEKSNELLDRIEMIIAYFGFRKIESEIGNNNNELLYAVPIDEPYTGDWHFRINENLDQIARKVEKVDGLSVTIEKFSIHSDSTGDPGYVRRGVARFIEKDLTITLYLLPAKEFFKPDYKIKTLLFLPRIIESPKKKNFWEFWK